MSETIAWKRLDRRGTERCEMRRRGAAWVLTGTAEFEHDILNYTITCDSRWFTSAASVRGSVGGNRIEIEISVDAQRRWRMNDADCAQVAGCIDVDLNFSPSTNLLPIRRLDLSVGEQAAVRAAWLRFPSFRLEPLEQIYRRVAEDKYRYESGGGTFVAELTVNAAGFVVNYPGFAVAMM